MNERKLYLIDEWLPYKRLSILAGASGAGKTTLFFQLAEAWLKGEDFLGHKTNGQDKGKLFYVSLDHEPDEVEELFDRMGLDRNAFGWRAMGDQALSFPEVFKVPKDTALLVIDGGEFLVENCRLSDFNSVQDSIRRMKMQARQDEMTILLLCGSPKLKENGEYMIGREKVLGSSVWGRMVATIFNLSHISGPSTPTSVDDRILNVFPRHARPAHIPMTLTDAGRLVPTLTESLEQDSRLQFISSMEVAKWYERKELVEMGAKHKLSPATVDRILHGLSKMKQLEKKYGEYRIPALANKVQAGLPAAVPAADSPVTE